MNYRLSLDFDFDCECGRKRSIKIDRDGQTVERTEGSTNHRQWTNVVMRLPGVNAIAGPQTGRGVR